MTAGRVVATTLVLWFVMLFGIMGYSGWGMDRELDGMIDTAGTAAFDEHSARFDEHQDRALRAASAFIATIVLLAAIVILYGIWGRSH